MKKHHAATRMGLGCEKKRKRSTREARRYPELTVPGEKVQIEVKEVPYHGLKGIAHKLIPHLSWSNHKPMRTLAWLSPHQRLAAFLGSHH